MIGVKAWLVISESGQSFMEELRKHSIMKRAGLPARDLRALDPVLWYPSSILGRERAIVVNLKHIRAIVTAKEVLLINYNNPLVVQFVQDLQNRIAFGNNNNPVAAQQARDHNGTEMEEAEEATWGSPTFSRHHVSTKSLSKRSTYIAVESTSNSTVNITAAAGPKVLPFEFRALEACLESACRCLESETRTLEEGAYPALDELTSKISTLNLELVRQIKSRLVAISGRVQKVRDELEHLLDDDNDMADVQRNKQVHYMQEFMMMNLNYDSKSKFNNSEIYDGIKPDVEEMEMLLEAYFAQIDGILQKLSHMSEYVNDTEDFINIMLDDKQNQLLQMRVMLGATNMILNAGIVVVGLFAG